MGPLKNVAEANSLRTVVPLHIIDKEIVEIIILVGKQNHYYIV